MCIRDRVQPDKVEKIVEEHLKGGKPVEEYAISEEDKEFIGKQQRVVLRHCGLINPEKIEEYLAVGGYEATKKVVTSMTQDEVIAEIKTDVYKRQTLNRLPATVLKATAKKRSRNWQNILPVSYTHL